MGDIRRFHKKYLRPKKPFEKARIEAEAKILKQYGLKNKRELWKMDALVTKIRKQVKSLIGNPDEDSIQKFISKLQSMGLKVKSLEDALGLSVNDLLERRLQTIVFRKNIARTINQARQMIVHKHIAINGKIVNIPSRIISKELENLISFKK